MHIIHINIIIYDIYRRMLHEKKGAYGILAGKPEEENTWLT